MSLVLFNLACFVVELVAAILVYIQNHTSSIKPEVCFIITLFFVFHIVGFAVIATDHVKFGHQRPSKIYHEVLVKPYPNLADPLECVEKN